MDRAYRLGEPVRKAVVGSQAAEGKSPILQVVAS